MVNLWNSDKCADVFGNFFQSHVISIVISMNVISDLSLLGHCAQQRYCQGNSGLLHSRDQVQAHLLTYISVHQFEKVNVWSRSLKNSEKSLPNWVDDNTKKMVITECKNIRYVLRLFLFIHHLWLEFDNTNRIPCIWALGMSVRTYQYPRVSGTTSISCTWVGVAQESVHSLHDVA